MRRAPLPGERDMSAMQGTATRSASVPGRRTFCRAIAVGLAGGLVARAVGAAPPRLRIGCTGLIWGATPRTPENLATAVADMASLGYHCFETWGSVMQALDEKGGLGDLLAKHPIPFRSAFMGVNVHDPSKLKESLAQVITWGKVTRKYGGTFAVVNAGGVDRKSFDFKAARAHIVSGLNEHGKALQDLGLQAGLHQHTGSAVDTRDEVYAVMEAVDSRYMKFAPDVGQLQKAGADAAANRPGFPADRRAHASQGLQRRRALPRLLPARPGQGRSAEDPAGRERRASRRQRDGTSSTARRMRPTHRGRRRRSARHSS